MEGIEMEGPISPVDELSDDFCNSTLARFSKSNNEEHQQLCAVLGAMSQELKDQNLPSTPIAYFGATCSSLERISSEPEPPTHILNALITILSLLLPRISPAILNKKRVFLSELVVRVLRSPSLTDGAATSGLKCISQLLTIRDCANWSDVSHLYGILLGFVTDSRPKVRRQSHLCLHELLQRFKATPMLAPASEGITNTFERLLLLAGGTTTNATERPKGAQGVVYILDALKECLPLMPRKYTTTILKYYKTLLELHQPILTKRITSSLNLLCIYPLIDVSAEVLLDLLCFIACSVSTNETSADEMAFTALLLDVGLQKVYSLNREICIIQLPIAFNALKDILVIESEEAIHAAIVALKELIHSCIDESLIKQGFDQLMMNTDMEERRSGPTVIEKLCVIIESLLDYHYTAVLDLVLQVVTAMFVKLGDYSSYFLSGTLKNLADMQKLPDKDFPFRKELQECLGSALGAMGPKTFLELIPLNLTTEDTAEANVWLFPILKQFTVGARLSFFRESILGMTGQMRLRTRQLELQGRIVSSRSVDALVYSLWSLLPSFCNYPLDTAECFKDLEGALINALNEEPDIRGLICSSLQILIQQNKRVLEGKITYSCVEVSSAQERAMAHYTPQVASANLTVLKSCASTFLSVLSSIFLKSMKDDGGSLQSTMGEFASIADKIVISKFLKSTMQKLLKVTQQAAKSENSQVSHSVEINNPTNESSPTLARTQLFDLAVSLLPGLDTKEIDLLFVAIRPALQDNEGLVQKKAYKVLSILLKNCQGFLSSKLEDLLRLMIEVLPSCHFSAKRHRLDCLFSLIVQVLKGDSESRRSDIISSFLIEIILALKEANKKTRNRAYDILVQIGHACADEEKGGRKENLYQFFDMVVGGLAGETPHMISAAMKGLARLAYEFPDLLSNACNLLPSTFLLLQRKNREIIKANLGFLKVMVAKSKAEGLHMHLKNLVDGLLKWQDGTKNHFKAKVKVLVEMLVGKCGIDAVKAVMPEEHMKLLTNIRKIKERKESKAKSEDKSEVSRATTSRMSRWNHSKIFSEFGVDESQGSDANYLKNSDIGSTQLRKGSSKLNSKASSLRFKSRAKRNLPDDHLEGEPLDLLDRHKTRSALQSSTRVKRKADSDDELDIDSEGRLIISEEEKPKKKSSNPSSDERSEAGSNMSNNSKKPQKRRKTSDSGWAYTGTEYASKKAGGDLKRKDKLEPYAYWPLDRKMMSRRPEHRATARKGMASVVRMTKKLEGKSASSLLSSKGLKFKKGGNKRGNKKKAK